MYCTGIIHKQTHDGCTQCVYTQPPPPPLCFLSNLQQIYDGINFQASHKSGKNQINSIRV